MLRRWLASRHAASNPAPEAPSTGLVCPTIPSTRLAAWLVDADPLGEVTRITLGQLLAAFPALTAADGAGPWFEAAFTRLAELRAQLERHPLPPALSEAQWRYLIVARCLYDCLEQALDVWQLVSAQGDDPHAAVCPLTAPAGEIAGLTTIQRRRPRRRGEDLPALTGLGSILAGRWLPPEGRALIVEAACQGVDWCRPEHFWAWLPDTDDRAATVTATSEPIPPAEMRPGVLLAPLPDTPPERSRPPSEQSVSRSPAHRSAGALAEPLGTALSDVLQALWREGRLNRRDGQGWVCDGRLHVVAKVLAERLVDHPALASQAHVFRIRKRLYRALLAHGLIEAQGPRPTRTVIVTEAGQQQRAAVVTLPLGLVWPEDTARPTAFSGTLSPCAPRTAAVR